MKFSAVIVKISSWLCIFLLFFGLGASIEHGGGQLPPCPLLGAPGCINKKETKVNLAPPPRKFPSYATASCDVSDRTVRLLVFMSSCCMQ